MKLHRLPTWVKKHVVRVVVEAPRDSKLKLKYEPALSAITWGHPLPMGFAYPYDWGFVPSTLAADGDPLDALVLSEVPSHPGVVIPCRPFGVLELDQKEDGERTRNDRLVVLPLEGRRSRSWSTSSSARCSSATRTRGAWDGRAPRRPSGSSNPRRREPRRRLPSLETQSARSVRSTSASRSSSRR